MTTELTSPVTVVCCSGGGIRSASFNLGALQALAAHKTPVDPATIVAVSGGAYITASHALVADESPDRPALHDVYRSGSPEEDHLRDNSRYLLPDGKTGLWAAVRLLGGLLFNLALLVLWVFVGGHVLGWLLHWWGILTGLQVGRPSSSVGWAWVVPTGLAALSLLLAFGHSVSRQTAELGVEISISPETMVSDGKVVKPWAKGTFSYTWDDPGPGLAPRTGTIYLCKLGVWPGAPWDVKAYAARHPTFPTDATIQQLYDDEEFESYRALGYAATTAMLDDRTPA